MAIQGDLRPQARQVGLLQQAAGGDGELVGVTEQVVAIAVGQVAGLHQQMDGAGAVEPAGLQGEGLEQGQELQQGEAAAGRGHGEDGRAAKATLQGRHQAGPIALKIAPGDQPAPLGHQARQSLGHRSAVKTCLPLGGDAPQGAGQLGLAQQLAGARGLGQTIGAWAVEERPGGGIGLELGGGVEGTTEGGANGKALLRQAIAGSITWARGSRP